MRNSVEYTTFFKPLLLWATTLVLLGSTFAAVAAPLKDPTRPPYSAKASKSQVASPVEEYRLSSIRIRAGSKTAILNGQSVSEGQHLGRAVVRKIESNQVILSRNGKRRVVSLFPNTLNKQSNKVP